MKQLIPIYYARLPWNIVLTHFRENLMEWNDKYPGKLHHDNFLERAADRFRLSEDEIHFRTALGLQYPSTLLVVKNTAIAEVCRTIQIFWKDKSDKSSDLKLAYDRAFDANTEIPVRSALQDKVNKYFNKLDLLLDNKSLVVQTLVLFIVDVAIHIVQEDPAFGELSSLQSIRRAVLKRSAPNLLVEQDTKGELNKFWTSKTWNVLPFEIAGAYFRCYERTDGMFKEKAIWGVAKSDVNFGKIDINGHVSVTMISKKGSETIAYHGLAMYDVESEYLIIHLFRHSDGDGFAKSAFFLMKVKSQWREPNLFLGTLTYYSDYYSRYLTKTVVWERGNLSTEAEELSNIDDGFENIPLSIRQYLYDRRGNRLSLPSADIFNLNDHDKRHSLQSLILSRAKNLATDDVLELTVGKYSICYYPSDLPLQSRETQEAWEHFAKNVIVDELEITYNKYSTDFEAVFTHSLRIPEGAEYAGQRESSLRGIVRRKRYTIEVILETARPDSSHEGYFAGSSPKTEFVLLTFAISKLKASSNKAVIFHGIISGLSDFNDQSLSCRTAVVKWPGADGLANEALPNVDFSTKKGIASKIFDYFIENRSQSRIIVKSPNDDLQSSYDNIARLVAGGGKIEIETIAGPSGNISWQVACFDAAGRPIRNATIAKRRVEDSLAFVDDYLGSSYFDQD